MKTTHARTAAPTSVSTKRAAKLERLGRYEEALGLFGDGWENEGFVPVTEHLPEADAAETCLRFGSLIGFYGYNNRLAQARAMDILTGAREQFLALGNTAKVAESENHIALAYWRRGEFREAKAWVAESLSHSLPDTCDARHHGLLVTSVLLVDEKKDEENIDWCLAHKETFRRYAHPLYAGALFANLGVSYRNLGRSAEAMRYFCQARSFHEQSGNKTYLAIVHNNLALLYNAERRFQSAHESADAAIRIHKQARDKTREASSLDSKAHIYLTEGRLADAAKTIDRSIAMLRKSEGSAYLAESLFTKALVMLADNAFDEAFMCVGEAVKLSRLHNSEEAGQALAADFLEAVRRHFEPVSGSAKLAEGALDLVLPPDIARYGSYRGLWINSEQNEALGLAAGSLAVLANAEPSRGDIVALRENNSGAIHCGSYDADFGMICIDRGDNEPLLYDSTDVEILGVVVGVSSGVPDGDGKTRVKAL